MTAERPLNPLEVEAIRSERQTALLILANSIAELRRRYQMRWGISTPGDWRQAGMVWMIGDRDGVESVAIYPHFG